MRNRLKQVSIHPSLHLALNMANMEACLMGSSYLELSHLLLATLNIIDDNFDQAAEKLHLSAEEIKSALSVAAECRAMLQMSDEEITAARRGLRQALDKEEEAPLPHRILPRSSEFNYLFHKAARRMVRAGAYELNLAHFLETLLANMPDRAAPFFKVAPTEETDSLAAQSFDDGFAIIEMDEASSAPTLSLPREAAPGVKRVGRDLSALARENRLRPIVGRRAEMTALARYLQRTSRRNVMVTGASGVGKRTLIEGLARELTGENVPDFLRSLRIIRIQPTDLLSATRSPYDMEQRTRALLAEATANPNVVLFFDEIHLMVSHDASGALPLNLINIIKPALINGEYRCIGTAATTEFELYLKTDAALMRQFQVLPLKELPEPEIIQICSEWARRIETAQNVKFEDAAILAAVTLTARIEQGSALPDKAIDLLENAATFVKVTSLSFNESSSQEGDPLIKREDIVQILKEQYGPINFR